MMVSFLSVRALLLVRVFFSISWEEDEGDRLRDFDRPLTYTSSSSLKVLFREDLGNLTLLVSLDFSTSIIIDISSSCTFARDLLRPDLRTIPSEASDEDACW
jgi:hypothetical protein